MCLEKAKAPRYSPQVPAGNGASRLADATPDSLKAS